MDQFSPKKQKIGVEGDAIVQNFMEWMNQRHFIISPKVQIKKASTSERYGLVALENITEGEQLFQVPRSSLLWEQTSSISGALTSSKALGSTSGWVKLVLCLMYEYTNKSSLFRPYLDFAPSVECMDQPMFWNETSKQWLKGTGVLDAVSNDLSMIEREYNEIALPFIKSNLKLGFNESLHDINLYKHMVAFVMAYSFTETSDGNEVNTPFMVPLADVLNHVAKNNACLEYETTHLKMIATRDIAGDEQIYNTYGCVANWQLLQMYGFVLKHPCNIYDTVDLMMETFYGVLKTKCSLKSNQEKFKWLTTTGGLLQNSPITVGIDGILSHEEFQLFFKVIQMTPEEFKSFCIDFETDNWETESSESSEEDSEFEMLPFRKLAKMSQENKIILKEVVSLTLSQFYSETKTQSLSAVDQWRYNRACTLIQGQTTILNTLLNAIND